MELEGTRSLGRRTRTRPERNVAFHKPAFAAAHFASRAAALRRATHARRLHRDAREQVRTETTNKNVYRFQSLQKIPATSVAAT